LSVRRGGEDISDIIDNRRVVPYSPYLSLRYKADINVEVCGSVTAVKYIHEYIYKGGNRATVMYDSEQDAIKQYLHGRYIRPTEAIWCLFEFSPHGEEPPMMHLALHLPNEQPIYFSEWEDPAILRPRIHSSLTTLMAYFKYNSKTADGRQYLYHEFLYTMCIRARMDRNQGVTVAQLTACMQLAPLWENATTCTFS